MSLRNKNSFKCLGPLTLVRALRELRSKIGTLLNIELHFLSNMSASLSSPKPSVNRVCAKIYILGY